MPLLDESQEEKAKKYQFTDQEKQIMEELQSKYTEEVTNKYKKKYSKYTNETSKEKIKYDAVKLFVKAFKFWENKKPADYNTEENKIRTDMCKFAITELERSCFDSGIYDDVKSQL